jgi:toxin secretion/phage lysis holin
MKNIYLAAVGAIGGLFGHFFGRWDALIEAMIVFMIIDIITGIIVAAWFNRSDKSSDGKLWSVAMWRGMSKKGMGLFFVIIGCQLDIIANTDYIRSAVIFCIIANELLSIIENAGIMGVPIPDILKRMLTVLNDKVVDKAADKFSDDVINKLDGKNDDKKE